MYNKTYIFFEILVISSQFSASGCPWKLKFGIFSKCFLLLDDYWAITSSGNKNFKKLSIPNAHIDFLFNLITSEVSRPSSKCNGRMEIQKFRIVLKTKRSSCQKTEKIKFRDFGRSEVVNFR